MVSPIKKIKLSFLLGAFVFFSLAGSLAWLTPAHAQLVTSDVNSGTQLGLEQADKIKLTIKEKAVMLMMQAVMSGLNYFMNKIAYDSAVYLASGGHGQNPLAHKDGPAGYFKNVAGDALGEALGEISNGTGFNLCDLPDPRLDLALKLSLHLQYSEPKPKCSWQQIKAAYNTDNIKSKYFSKEGALSRIAVSMEVGGSDFGVWLEAKNKIDQHANEAQIAAETERNEGNGFKSMTDIITGEVKTPAAVIEQEFKAGAPSQQKDSQSTTMGPLLGSAMQKGALSVVYQAAGTFVNTLLGTMLKNFTTKGMLPTGTKLCNPGLSISGITLEPCAEDQSSSLATGYYASGSGSSSNRRLAQEMFNDLLVPKIKTVENFEIINNLANCTEEDKNPYSCLVDQPFIQILQSAEANQPLTIREAIEKGWIHGDWKIISAKDNLQNTKWNCAEEAYCARNLQVLRKLRILPLGAEIAAVVMPNIDEPPTFKQVMDGFTNASSPYYRLLNPNWLVKLPKIRCNSQVPGQVPQNGARLEECVDLQHCVGYNKDGSCSTYGYCLKENQVWTFSSDYCEWQNDTCKTFADDANGENVSYLYRTVDNRFCDENNVGCRRYSTISLRDGSSASPLVDPEWAPTDWFTDIFASFASRLSGGQTPLWISPSLNLNSKVESCSADNDGCSAFKVATDLTKTIYLKKAPDYLGCYDSEVIANKNSLSSQIGKLLNGIKWPQTVADLGRIQPLNEEACKNDYAHVCLPEEAGCNYYISESTGEKIPGKFKPAELVTNPNTGEQEIQWNNQCDQKCLGYDAFRIMPSAYDTGKAVDYIIPSSGQTCSASEVGCTSFTNLNEVAGDFEKVEYFSYLRSCIPPDQNKQKTFYSYESTENGDIRLSTFVLEFNPATGGPKLIYNSPADYTANSGKCSQALYGLATTDPNCRRLDDDAGRSYYVMINKTILVSEQCTPYRLNETAMFTEAGSSNTYCPYEYAGPDTKTDSLAVRQSNNACYYYGMPGGNTGGAGDTMTCGQEVNSCRAYKGNAGNNYRVVLDEHFENYSNTDDMKDFWRTISANAPDIQLSTESTNANGHSMKVDPPTNGGVSTVFRDNVEIKSGKSYNVSFWARGGGQLNEIILRNSRATASLNFLPAPINITDVWHYYSFGPVDYNEADDLRGDLQFRILGSTGSRDIIYFDNVRLTENVDNLYLVRNSLSVDPICDSEPGDNLPGEALGCRAYKDSTKTNFYLTGFSYLCREDAVGCVGLIDTFNTLDQTGAKAYHVWYQTDPLFTGNALATVNGYNYTCFVPRGAGGCYMDILGTTSEIAQADSNLHFTNATQYFPADTSTSSPVYLVVNEKSVCRSENLGCQKAGLATESVDGENFDEVYVKNNPALYGNILCNDTEVGCKSYSADGGKYYFKDPKITGGRLCEWRSTAYRYGWYLQGTDEPCYPNYIFNSPFDNTSRTVYGLLSNGHSDYNGSVGICSGDQNGCSEFADPVGASNSSVYKHCAKTNVRCYVDSDCEEEGDSCISNSSAQSYFLLDNDALREGVKECNGLVSVHEGCVLFDKTSNPNKYWNASASYSSTGELREAVASSNAIQNDANVILKVSRDRICTDWAFCSDYQVVKDPETGEITRKCHRLGVCEKSGETAGTNVAGVSCEDVVTDDWSVSNKILDLNLFRNRSLGYSTAEEYSGYAVFDRFQISDYAARRLPVAYGNPENTDSNAADISMLVVSKSSPDCTSILDESASVSCTAADGIGTGLCYRGECIMDLTGKTTNLTDLTNESRKLSCRAYPETTSPFDVSVFRDPKERELAGYKAGFEDVGVCAGDTVGEDSCDCNYVKYKTSVGDVFVSNNWESGGKNIPALDYVAGHPGCGQVQKTNEMCKGGRYDGYYCDSNASSLGQCEVSQGVMEDKTDLCSENGGICSQIKGKNIMAGWQGYCMEDDVRQKINGVQTDYHCLSWWPIESVSSDFWLMDPNAGYKVGEMYERNLCLTSETANYSGSGLLEFNDTNSSLVGAYIPYEYFQYNDSGDITYPSGITLGKAGGVLSVANMPSNAMFIPAMEEVTHTPNPSTFKYHWGINFAVGGKASAAYSSFEKNYFQQFLQDYKKNSTFAPAAGSVTYAEAWANYFNTIGDWQHSWRFVKGEVEQLDVLLDDAEAVPYGDNGSISFINQYGDAPFEGDTEQTCDFSSGDCCVAGAFCVRKNVDTTGINDMMVARRRFVCQDSNKEFELWEWNMFGGTPTNASRKDHFNAGNFVNTLCAHLADNYGYKEAISTSRLSGDGGDPAGVGVRLLFTAGNDKVLGTADDVLQGNWVAVESPDHSGSLGYSFIFHQAGGSCAEYARVAKAVDDDPLIRLDSFDFKPVTWRLVTDQVGLQGMYGPKDTDEELSEHHTNGRSIVARVKNLDGSATTDYEYGLMRSLDLLYSSERKVGPLVNPFMPIADRIFALPVAITINSSRTDSSGSVLYAYDEHEGGIPLISVDQAAVVGYGSNDYASGDFLFDFSGNVPCKSNDLTDTPYCQMFKKMFAEVYGGSGKVKAFDAAKPDNAAKIGLTVYPPHIAAPTGQENYEFRLDDFSVNGFNNGNVVLSGSGDEVNIKFYAWADPNQMPLRRIAVNAGDGTESVVSRELSIGNRKPNCDGEKYCYYGDNGNNNLAHWQLGCKSDADCGWITNGGAPLAGRCREPLEEYNPNGFGNTDDTGCKTEPFEYVISYHCASGSATQPANSVLSADELSFWHISANTQVCVYKPKVQVLDNWGWCTGYCNTSPYTSNGNPRGFWADRSDYGCYDDQNNLTDCGIDAIDGLRVHWVEFPGLVIVPQK